MEGKWCCLTESNFTWIALWNNRICSTLVSICEQHQINTWISVLCTSWSTRENDLLVSYYFIYNTFSICSNSECHWTNTFIVSKEYFITISRTENVSKILVLGSGKAKLNFIFQSQLQFPCVREISNSQRLMSFHGQFFPAAFRVAIQKA